LSLSLPPLLPLAVATNAPVPPWKLVLLAAGGATVPVADGATADPLGGMAPSREPADGRVEDGAMVRSTGVDSKTPPPATAAALEVVTLATIDAAVAAAAAAVLVVVAAAVVAAVVVAAAVVAAVVVAAATVVAPAAAVNSSGTGDSAPSMTNVVASTGVGAK
jgi:hypothetical protein